MTVSPAAISGAEYYASDNYYLAEEGPSEWGGAGAAKLGLNGPVDAAQFARIIDGVLPSGDALAAGPDGKRNPGLDLTFSAPKSVSLLGLIGGDQKVIAAHRAAVRDTMAWAEERFALARAGKGGNERIETGNLVYGHFHHDLSRALDPQVHTHVAIANMTQRPDGEWRALHNVKLWQHAPVIGAAYHALLRANLREIGYETVITGKHGQFEVTGISQEAIDAFSKRRADIVAKADELGASSPKAMEQIAVRTRDAKQAGSAEVARERWATEAVPYRAEIAATIERAHARSQPRSVLNTIRSWGDAVLARVTRALGPKPDSLMEGTDKLRSGAQLAAAYSVAAGLRHLTERESSFGRINLIQAALGFAENGATVRNIEARIDRLISEGSIINGRAGSEHAGLLTTRELKATDNAIIAAVTNGVGQGVPLMSESAAQKQIGAIEVGRGFTLSDEQRSAALALLSGRNAIQIIQGDAGSGKSALFAFVDEVAKTAGPAPLFLTSQAALVADMRADGLDAQTLASLLVRHGGQGGRTALSAESRSLLSGRLVVVEEASMIASRDAALLINLTTRAGAAKLAFVGDAKQIGSVGAGRPFALMQEYGAPTETLSENRRQINPALREAVACARAGDIAGTFAALGNRIIEHRDPAAAAARVYLALLPEERERTAVLTSGHVLREMVLDHVRGELIARGELGSKALTIETFDRLNLTREEMRQIGHWATGMVLELHHAQVGLDRGQFRVGIVSRDDHLVQLRSRQGGEYWLDPREFHSSGSGAGLAVPGQIEVREGDRLVFTGPDKGHGVVNGTRATVTGIEGDTLHLAGKQREYVLGPDDPARGLLGHVAVINMHRAQGITVDRAINVMSSHDRLLNSKSLHYVLQTRAREEVTLLTEDKEALRTSIEGHRGEPAHAADIAPELRDAGGERFDPKTGEMLSDPSAKKPSAAQLFERAMAQEFPQAREQPEPAKEKEIEREVPDIADDFDMGM
jgi:conjugative relaxase-like TrwC/TraI family protein